MRKGIIAVLILVITIGLLQGCENRYEREVKVVKIQGQEVFCKDKQGHGFSFYGEGYRKGEKLILQMDNNNTDDITDDIIVSVSFD